ncbi:MAG: hypothetical protein AAF581_10580 [Planctomycetota bacterium]
MQPLTSQRAILGVLLLLGAVVCLNLLLVARTTLPPKLTLTLKGSANRRLWINDRLLPGPGDFAVALEPASAFGAKELPIDWQPSDFPTVAIENTDGELRIQKLDRGSSDTKLGEFYYRNASYLCKRPDGQLDAFTTFAFRWGAATSWHGLTIRVAETDKAAWPRFGDSKTVSLGPGLIALLANGDTRGSVNVTVELTEYPALAIPWTLLDLDPSAPRWLPD